MASRQKKKRFMATAGAFGESGASGCSGSGGRKSNGTSRINSIRVEWTGSTSGVVAENLIRAENTAVTPIDEIIKFQDEPRFHRTVHALCLHVSNPYGPPGRDCGSTPPDRRASTQRAEASALQAI